MSDGMTIYGTISLGALTALLERRPQDQDVAFDFGGLTPDSIDSYRGYYDHLAIGYKVERESRTVGDLLKALRAALGKHHEGYKGGGGTATAETPVWVAQWGECFGTGIVGIVDDVEYMTILRTEYVG